MLAGVTLLATLSWKECSEQKKAKTNDKSAFSAKKESLYVAILRTGCYGRCPIDEVELLPEGKVRYRGKRFVPRIGLYERTLSEKELMEFRRLLSEGSFDSYKDVYDNPHITDLPSLILRYRVGDREKSITCRTGCPPELPSKIETLRAFLAEKGDFQMIEGPDSNDNSDAE